MQRNKTLNTVALSLARRIGMFGIVLAGAAAGGTAQAQELTHRFINPSFGGNPFNSDHLLGIANIHRPDEPEEEQPEPDSFESQQAETIRRQLSAQIFEQIREKIRDAKPGESGTFEAGDQRISFTRTATETRVTFTNITTGKTEVVVVPVESSSTAFAAATSSAPSLSAEQALGAIGTLGTVPNGPLSSGLSTSLLGSPPPLGSD